MKWRAPLFLLATVGACADLPRDQAGTLDRISEEGVLRVGIVATPAPPHQAERLGALIDRVARASGGQVERVEGAAEPLLLMLEAGEVDLVAGEFERSSPWSRRVHLLPPLASAPRGKGEVETTAAVRNGENAWIMLLEREARAIAAAP